MPHHLALRCLLPSVATNGVSLIITLRHMFCQRNRTRSQLAIACTRSQQRRMTVYGPTWTRPRCECRQIACSRPACRSAPSLMLLLTVLREARHGPSLLHAIWSLRGHVLSDVEDRLQSYIRPTYAASVLIAAGPGGIRRKTPHLLQGLAARVHIQASVFRGPTAASPLRNDLRNLRAACSLHRPESLPAALCVDPHATVAVAATA